MDNSMATKRRWKTPNELVTLKKKRVPNIPYQPKPSTKRPQEYQSTTLVKKLKTDESVSIISHSEPCAMAQSLPPDMSLKNKMRITSTQSFSWLLSAKLNQEALGLVTFTKGQSLPEDAVSAFYHSLMYWVHPSMTSLSVISHEAPPTSLDGTLTEALKDDWIVSFHSLFQLLKAGHCSYFYICGCSFSVFFQRSHALLSPTTSGLREALKKEGVEYSLPLSSMGSHAAADGDLEEDELSAANWLQSIGLQSHEITSHQQKAQDIDSHPESTVCVDEGHLFALCNFLINCKTLIPSTGQYSGIPPTLVAPTAFIGGTLATLKVKQSNQQESLLLERQMKHSYSLEISGPVLPQTISSLCEVFQRTQEGNFDIYLSTLKPSTSFNVPPNFTLQYIKCSDNSFTWN